MMYSYSTLFTINVIKSALSSNMRDMVLTMADDTYRKFEMYLFNRLFEIEGPKVGIEELAKELELSEERASFILDRMMLKFRKYPGSEVIFENSDLEAISEETNTELDNKWNTDPQSCLYYMNGSFYVNRNPYCPDSEAPQKGIPFNHSNKIRLMNMFDLFSTAIVLGQDSKRGLFLFESAWGMQGARYKSDSNQPFPYDEIRFTYGKNEDNIVVGFFAYRKDRNWGILCVGDEKNPCQIHEDVLFGESSFEEAVLELSKKTPFRIEREWTIS